ncbi:hypothetical protein [Pseudomonas syringae group genomosp. 3]|uniref:hypothetical protein n=1 Tax=Pseudomonas syringae group genomosp. 3 TaxID=251701 RepID=UPI0007111AA0|nr:hypothetical protein [Pseudomonas syringae group genomosp. 3]
MSKQYYINGIRFDKHEEHIEFVSVRKDGTKEHYLVPRGFVALLIKSGISFKTRYNKDKKWHTGAEVEVYDETFLRANPNETSLGSVPVSHW